MTPREESGELLLGSPEFLAWLERLGSEPEFVAWLELQGNEDEDDESTKAA